MNKIKIAMKITCLGLSLGFFHSGLSTTCGTTYIGTYDPAQEGNASGEVCDSQHASLTTCTSQYFNSPPSGTYSTDENSSVSYDSEHTYYSCQYSDGYCEPASGNNPNSGSWSSCSLPSPSYAADGNVVAEFGAVDYSYDNANVTDSYGTTGGYYCCQSSTVGNDVNGDIPNTSNNRVLSFWAPQQDGCGQTSGDCTAATVIAPKSNGQHPVGTLDSDGIYYLTGSSPTLGTLDSANHPVTSLPVELYYAGGNAAAGNLYWENCWSSDDGAFLKTAAASAITCTPPASGSLKPAAEKKKKPAAHKQMKEGIISKLDV